MKYNFDEIVDRKNTNCIKYDKASEVFGSDEVIPMWIADMDFRTPDFILEAIKKRTNDPILGYFYHSDGFYNSIIGWMKRRHGWNIEKEWIHFSPGIVTGLAALVQAFTQKKDKIIIQTPVYHPFYAVIENQDRTLVKNPLKLENDVYTMDFEDLEKKLKEGAAMLILCNPHNPVSRCWTPEELQKLGELCLRYHCLVVSDEIHADLIMPGYKHTPMAAVSDAIAANTITCMAPSKTFNIAGLSTSEVIIPNKELGNIYDRFMDEKLHLLMGNTFGDVALEAAYSHGDAWLDQLVPYLAENVHYCHDFITKNIPGLKTYPHEATYILWIDFRNLGIPHEELKKILVEKAKLGLNDGLLFGTEGEGFMRMNLACPKSVVEKAMTNLKNVFA